MVNTDSDSAGRELSGHMMYMGVVVRWHLCCWGRRYDFTLCADKIKQLLSIDHVRTLSLSLSLSLHTHTHI
jgi:hypothetical protein